MVGIYNKNVEDYNIERIVSSLFFDNEKLVWV